MTVARKIVRCAIYTRKSTEDGLEQEFNSLHAQREACEAYILSQRHEGWTLIPDDYDDGGFSGGSMARPGLQRLLADVETGRVDVIVVYKVDRLTRSLADFAKIVERLDAKEASFVSVTQAFNTTTSMGRLTLNVLLSFAQFEREVTSERIRDKIAASKKKGLWMGGPVPLGYVVKDRKLVVEPAEAEQVRHIMRRYVGSGSSTILLAVLAADGVRTKIQRQTSGPHRGGIPFARGSLFHLLKNPVYRGMIVHKGEAYPGEHEPIVDEELWNEVQSRLAEKAPPRKHGTNRQQDAFFLDRLFDPGGRPMVVDYSVNGVRRYRYYQSRRDLVRKARANVTRISVGVLEQYIVGHLRALLGDQHQLRRISGITDGARLALLFANADRFLHDLGDPSSREAAVRSLVKRVQINTADVAVRIGADVLVGDGADVTDWDLTLASPPQKPFREAKLMISAGDGQEIERDEKLVDLISEAFETRALVRASPDVALHKLAEREGRCRKQMTQLLKISWLSPPLVNAIMNGSQPAGLTRKRLMAIDLPRGWADQERLLGYQRLG
ncbi:recombinase family protein [Sphingopyxis sp.]|uniref:recombinase family protein n=1 Tax=Sphingopyxis sp. TaxID=1908224 RepID=UPI002D7F4FB8|nr:recombinase family protein [Sphingopyxis sp.]